MTQRLNKINRHINGRGSRPKLELCHLWARGPIKNENKHSNPDKMGRLQYPKEMVSSIQALAFFEDVSPVLLLSWLLFLEART